MKRPHLADDAPQKKAQKGTSPIRVAYAFIANKETGVWTGGVFQREVQKKRGTHGDTRGGACMIRINLMHGPPSRLLIWYSQWYMTLLTDFTESVKSYTIGYTQRYACGWIFCYL